MEALPGSSGAETRGRLEDRAPSPDEQAGASPAWRSSLRGPNLAIFGFRGTGKFLDGPAAAYAQE